MAKVICAFWISLLFLGIGYHARGLEQVIALFAAIASFGWFLSSWSSEVRRAF